MNVIREIKSYNRRTREIWNEVYTRGPKGEEDEMQQS